jgi:hypothetical protein
MYLFLLCLLFTLSCRFPLEMVLGSTSPQKGIRVTRLVPNNPPSPLSPRVTPLINRSRTVSEDQGEFACTLESRRYY